MINKQRERIINISVGIFILLGLLSLSVLVMKVSGISNLNVKKTYSVTADFADIGGLKVRAPVTIAGVKVGEVSRIELQPEQLNAKVTMLLQADKPIPFDDTSARILTEGILGSNYVSIVPGFDSQDGAHPYLRAGDRIAKTEQAIILENLIGQLIFNINK